MRVYFASIFTIPELIYQLPDLKKCGVLTSYVEVKNKNDKKMDYIKKCPCNVFLDSGAFSLFTGKAKISIYDYKDFLLKHKNKFSLYANLDIIGNAEKTKENQNILEREGLNPLPTFHYGTNYEILKELASKYDYIGLGGLVPLAFRKRKILHQHLSKCFSIIGSTVKTHGWGMTSVDVLKKYPFYSVDSTSWLFGGARRQKIINYKNLKINQSRDKITHYRKLNIFNAIEIYRMVKTIDTLWEKRGVKWED